MAAEALIAQSRVAHSPDRSRELLQQAKGLFQDAPPEYLRASLVDRESSLARLHSTDHESAALIKAFRRETRRPYSVVDRRLHAILGSVWVSSLTAQVPQFDDSDPLQKDGWTPFGQMSLMELQVVLQKSRILYSAEQFAEARNELEQALQHADWVDSIDFTWCQAISELCDIQCHMADFEEAHETISAAVSILPSESLESPTFRHLRVSMLEVHIGRQDYELALNEANGLKTELADTRQTLDTSDRILQIRATVASARILYHLHRFRDAIIEWQNAQSLMVDQEGNSPLQGKSFLVGLSWMSICLAHMKRIQETDQSEAPGVEFRFVNGKEDFDRGIHEFGSNDPKLDHEIPTMATIWLPLVQMGISLGNREW